MLLCSDSEAALRFAGAAALTQLHRNGSRDAEKALWALLEDPSPRIRAKIADDLKWDDLPETGRLKQALARDHDAAVRMQAAGGLYLHNDEASRSALVALTQDPIDRVRAEALDAFQSIEEENNPPSPKDYLQCVADPSPLVRASMAAWLRWTESSVAFPHLIQLYRDNSDLVRFHAVCSLAGNSSEAATEVLVAATNDSDPSVRAEALRSLPSRQLPRCLELHLAHASDSSPEVRKTVAYFLERDPTPDLLPLLEKLSEDQANMNIRRAALRGIEKLPGPEAETLIVRMLRDPAQSIAKAAKKALEKRAKEQDVSRGTADMIRFGAEGALATRVAFHGRPVPMKAWEDFLENVARLDGRPMADSLTTPSVQIETKQGNYHCILPFGPAHWIRIDFLPQPGSPPLMAYAVQSTAEIDNWSQSVQVRHFAPDLKLAKHFGWFKLDQESIVEATSLEPTSPKSKRGRPRRQP